MNRREMLNRAAQLHRDWSEQHADLVPAHPQDSRPHNGRDSDYAEHHADRSAPASVDDELNRQLAALAWPVDTWATRVAGRMRKEK